MPRRSRRSQWKPAAVSRAATKSRHPASSGVIDRLSKDMNATLANPEFAAKLTNIGSELFSSSPAEFGAFLAAETEKWGKVVKFAGLKVD